MSPGRGSEARSSPKLELFSRLNRPWFTGDGLV